MQKELRNKLLAQVLLIFSQVVFPLLTYPIITKALLAGGLGKVNFADAIVQFLLIISSLGIPLYGVRQISIVKNHVEERSKTFLSLLLLQIIPLIPASFAVVAIGTASGVDNQLLYAGIVSLVCSALSFDWFLQGCERFLFLAIRTFVTRLAGLILVIIYIKQPADAFLYYWILAGTSALSMFLNLIAILPTIQFKYKPGRIGSYIREVRWLYACNLFGSVYAVIDSIVLGWISTDEAVGNYSFGYKIIRMSAMLVPTLGVVFIPRISYLHAANENEKLLSQVNSSQQLIYFIGIPISIAFFVLAPEIVNVFTAGTFIGSVNVIRILSLIPLLVSFSHLTGTQLLISINREKTYLVFLLAGCMLNLVFDFILIPSMQERGAAISNMVTETFVAVGTFIFLNKIGLLSLQARRFSGFLLTAITLIPIAWVLRQFALPSWMILSGSVLVSGMIHLAVHRKMFVVKSI